VIFLFPQQKYARFWVANIEPPKASFRFAQPRRFPPPWSVEKLDVRSVVQHPSDRPKPSYYGHYRLGVWDLGVWDNDGVADKNSNFRGHHGRRDGDGS
jgi:hypothetical protein